MSTVTVTKPTFIGGVLANITSIKLSDATGTYGVKRDDTDAVVVADGTAMVNSSTGLYTYSFTAPASGLTYTAAFEMVYQGATTRTTNTFTDPTASLSEPTTSWTYESLYTEVEARSSLSSADAKVCVDLAYMEFIRSYDWSFLRPVSSLSVEEDDETTALPANYGGIIGKFYYESGAGYRFLTEVTPEWIGERLAAGGDVTDIPRYYAIEPTEFTASTGQRYQVRWYPFAGEDLTLGYRYKIIPNKMVNAGDYPLGGAEHAYTILCLAMREADRRGTSQTGTIAGENERMANEALAKSILIDQQRSSGVTLGNLNRPLRRVAEGYHWTELTEE